MIEIKNISKKIGGKLILKDFSLSIEKGEFISVEDLMKRTKLNKTVTDLLKHYGCLPELSLTNQQTLF